MCPLRHEGVTVVYSGKHFKMTYKVQVFTLFIVCVVVGAASEVPHLQAADVETWSLTCDSSSIHITFRENDLINFVQLSAVEDKSNLIWLIHYARESKFISKNANFFNYTTFPVSYLARGNTTNNTSVFLQLFTVGHPYCSSQSPRLCSAESLLRNVDNLCTFTLKLVLAGSLNTTAKFATRNYTKLVCCIGDGCGNGADNGVTTDRRADDSYLEMAILHIRDNNVRNKLCRVINGVVNLELDGDVFYEGSLSNTGARLECHVPRELDCAEFQCQVITSTRKTLTQSLKYPKFYENQYCQKADSPLGSTTQGWMLPVTVTLSLALVVAIITAIVCRYRRNGSTQNPQSSASQHNIETQVDIPLTASDDNDNDNGHNG